MTPLRVTGDRVLVALPPSEEAVQDDATGFSYRAEQVSESGLILAAPGHTSTPPTRGIVMALGEKSGTVDLAAVLKALATPDPVAAVKRLRPAPFDVQVGEMVVFSSFDGRLFHQDGVTYVILRESEIIGVVTPQKVNAA